MDGTRRAAESRVIDEYEQMTRSEEVISSSKEGKCEESDAIMFEVRPSNLLRLVKEKLGRIEEVPKECHLAGVSV